VSTIIGDALREIVRRRAGERCEYCLIAEIFISPHEPDHIIAVQHRGPTSAENLALACFDCNRRKGPNISSVDPISGQIIPLFNPRRDIWQDHFQLDGARIVGVSPAGRATIELLDFNNPIRILIRKELQRIDRYPVK
jgi:HNH endonuclease